MTKEITPEVIEKAIDWLDTEEYCCHALACALSGNEYHDQNTKFEHIRAANELLRPLLARDDISASGSWTDSSFYRKEITRKDWLRKIAQELRDGKI